MILSSMSPREKFSQMQRVYDETRVVMSEKLRSHRFMDTIARTKVFPSFYTEDRDIEGMGKWTFIYTAESKSSIRKGVVSFKAYQKYYVSHSKNQSNNGTGIYLFTGDDSGKRQCAEFTPHYFNRLRERYVEPKGIVQPPFSKLVLMMQKMTFNSMDIALREFEVSGFGEDFISLRRNNGFDRQEGFENLVSYCEEGVSLGVTTMNKQYMLFMTFVPTNLLREGQLETQRSAMDELRRLEYQRRLNPFATIDKYEWVERGKDI